MEFDVRLTAKDWKAVIWISMTQISLAWIMAILDIVYAPIPMFAAAVVAGFLFKGRPKHASLAGALAGLMGGGVAEWAFHIVRIQNRLLNWSQLDSNEQMGLAVAEMLLYAALLSFFAAFFSWGTHKDTDSHLNSEAHESASSINTRTEKPTVDIPIFKDTSEPK